MPLAAEDQAEQLAAALSTGQCVIESAPICLASASTPARRHQSECPPRCRGAGRCMSPVSHAPSSSPAATRALVRRSRRTRCEALVARRAQGEPVAYLTGQREFWSLALKVTPATLIPRPETELLVEHALARIPQDAAWTVADLGTGAARSRWPSPRSGQRCRVIATDICDAALAVASENAARHGIANIEFRHGRWLAPFSGETFDLIVSNPPYVRDNDPHLAQRRCALTSRGAALVAGHDGLDAIRVIAAAARLHLRPGG